MPEHCVDLTAALQTMDQRLDVTGNAFYTPGGNTRRGGVPGRRGLMAAACLLIAACWLMPATGRAATFCVQTSADLATALLTAESNGAHDTIKIVQGTYQGPFRYASTEARNLTIQGGYTAACATRQVNPINTVLNGTTSGAALALESTAAGTLLVDGLTVQNGQQGLRMTTTGGQVTVGHTVIQQSGERNEQRPSDSYAGLAIDGASSVQITDNTIQQNNWHGIALSADSSVVTLHNNMIRENACGGVHMLPPVWQATLTSNTIHKNGTLHRYCAGVFISSYSHTTLMHNTITYNTKAGYGVDIGKSSRWRQGNAVLIGNVVNHNDYFGINVRGGFHKVILQKNVINFNDSDGVIISDIGARTTLSGNNILWNGRRGFELYDAGNVLLKNNLIRGNGRDKDKFDLFGGGGRIHNDGKSVTLKNNVISKNHGLKGGGLYIGGRPALVTMTNNTIHGNIATAAGGGVWLELYENTGQADIYNNIIWANTAPQGTALFLENNRNGDSIRSPVNLFNNTFAFSDLYRKRSFPIHSSNFNNVDPLFVNAASGDYHLQATSPLINQGHNTAPGLPAMDKEGQPRIDGVAVDLGAYETND
jgi:parallel beta-helix repeat protein